GRQIAGSQRAERPVGGEPEDDHPADELGPLATGGGLVAAGHRPQIGDDGDDRCGPDPRVGDPLPGPWLLESHAPPGDHPPSSRMYWTKRSSSSSSSVNCGMVARYPATISAWGSTMERRMYSSSADTVEPSSSSTVDPKRPLQVGATDVSSSVWQARQPRSRASSSPVAGPEESPPQAAANRATATTAARRRSMAMVLAHRTGEIDDLRFNFDLPRLLELECHRHRLPHAEPFDVYEHDVE